MNNSPVVSHLILNESRHNSGVTIPGGDDQRSASLLSVNKALVDDVNVLVVVSLLLLQDPAQTGGLAISSSNVEVPTILSGMLTH